MEASLEYSEEALTRALGSLSPMARSAFAAACAGRLVNSYDHVSKKIIGAEVEVLRKILGEVWKFSFGHEHSSLTGAIEPLSDLVPDEDSEETSTDDIADDSIAAVLYAAQSALGQDPRTAAWAARRAYEAADRHAAKRLNEAEYTESLEQRVLSSKVVQNELSRQRRDIAALVNAHSSGSSKVFESLKSRADREEVLSSDK